MCGPRLLLAIGLSVLVVGSAAAQPAPAPELVKFIQDAANQGATFEVIRTQSAGFPTPCGATKLPSGRVTVQKPPHYDVAGRPLDGIWTESWSGDRCGTPVTFNVVTLAKPDGTIQRAAMLPGNSRADIFLQRDSMLQAQTAITVAIRSCRGWIITDTAFIDFGAVQPKVVAGRDPRAWTERWTAAACGKTVILTMHFTPDATGTGINVSSKETIVR